MTTLYIIRHAEAEGNLYRIAQGQHESSLTDRGWRQVQALRERFLPLPVDAVYTSDLYRARATASAVSAPKGLPLYDVRQLREIRVGEWEGRTWGDIARCDPVKMKQFSREIDRWHVDGAEYPADVLQRVQDAVLRIAARHDGQHIAIVSHGYAIRLLLGKLEGYTLAQTGTTLHGDNTAVSILEADHGTFRLISRDDNSHLRTSEFLAREKPVRRHNALEPGLWFAERSMEDPRCEQLARDALREIQITTDPEFDRDRLITDAQKRLTLAGYAPDASQTDEPAGLLQLGPQPGWISLAYIRRELRGQGYGIHLLGQAVQHTRRHGGNRLYAAAKGDIGAGFFTDNGFTRETTASNGRTVWTKSIAFPPLDTPGGEFVMDIETGCYTPFSGIASGA